MLRLCFVFKGEWKESQSNGIIGDYIHFYGVKLLQKGRDMRIGVLQGVPSELLLLKKE